MNNVGDSFVNYLEEGIVEKIKILKGFFV